MAEAAKKYEAEMAAMTARKKQLAESKHGEYGTTEESISERDTPSEEPGKANVLEESISGCDASSGESGDATVLAAIGGDEDDQMENRLG